ncbi:MAG: MBL fold metallo-hydrolase [Saccharofermentans sp.]|nr:MBL fold metallo-hydrolase [Saccharofermentans sp.]
MDPAVLEGVKLQRFTWDVVDTNTYMLLDGNNALIVDPVDSQELFDAVADISHADIIITHSHFDHVSGLNRIREIISSTRVIATSECSEYIGSVYKNMSAAAEAFLGFYNQKREIENTPKFDNYDQFVCEPADVVFDDSYEFDWNGHGIRLIRCFGHSKDSLIALFDGRFLFSGDTLLKIPTATRFLGGSTARFWKEDYPLLERLASSVETVFPGHGESGSVEEMLAVNVMPEKYRGK